MGRHVLLENVITGEHNILNIRHSVTRDSRVTTGHQRHVCNIIILELEISICMYIHICILDIYVYIYIYMDTITGQTIERIRLKNGKHDLQIS